MENERSLNHGLDIGAAVGVAGWQELIVRLYVMQSHGVSKLRFVGAAVGVAGWQELIVGLYVMQRHGVSSEAYMGRYVGPLLYLTKLDVKYDHL